MIQKYRIFQRLIVVLCVVCCLIAGGCQSKNMNPKVQEQENSVEQTMDSKTENQRNQKESNSGGKQTELEVTSEDKHGNTKAEITQSPDLSQKDYQEEIQGKNDTERKKEIETNKVIVIDAGHQAKENSEKEPIGPGAKEKKKKVSSGTQGIKTRVPEYKVNLSVALKLEKLLTDMGYKVIMVRRTDDVNISNSERAAIANKNNADVFVRIHCNGSENHSISGVLTICQTKDNPYCGPELYECSRDLSESILSALCEVTGANNRGVTETDTMSGINWSKVPVTIVEMGYMTNEREEKLLINEEYQEKLSHGIANGIRKYFAHQQ